GFPEHFAGRRIDGGHAAAERAAAVLRVRAAHGFADSGHRHEQSAVVQRERARASYAGVILDARAPDLLARVGVECIDVALMVYEVNGVAFTAVVELVGTDGRCAAQSRF